MMRMHGRLALCGAIGGAVNAWLCYARLPVSVGGDPTFAWHVVPAGAVHGAALAALAFWMGTRYSNSTVLGRLAWALPVAWVAGFGSWIPLNRSAFDEPWLKSLTWPFHEGLAHGALFPFVHFGLVGLLYYLWLAFGGAKRRSALTHVLAAMGAGALGSLWWWISWEPWYFSVLHGAIWGAWVGMGAWTATRGATMAASVA
jgi:hypothetical protein